MSALEVFRHDLTVVRKTLVGRLVGALALAGPLGGVLAGMVLASGRVTGEFLTFSVWLVAGTVLSLGALATAAVALAAARESGRLRLVLGTPVTTGDVFAGTLLTRVAVTGAATVAGFALAAGAAAALGVGIADAARAFAPMAGFTVLLCAAYTAVGLAVSAVAQTRLRAVAGALGFYAWAAFWPQLVSQVAEPGGPSYGAPTAGERLAHFAGTLSPFGAYSQAVTPAQAIYAESVAGWLLATPTMAVILGGWTVFPALAGYWWFDRIDL